MPSSGLSLSQLETLRQSSTVTDLIHLRPTELRVSARPSRKSSKTWSHYLKSSEQVLSFGFPTELQMFYRNALVHLSTSKSCLSTILSSSES